MIFLMKLFDEYLFNFLKDLKIGMIIFLVLSKVYVCMFVVGNVMLYDIVC